jgi:hypothetical protein
MDGRAIHGTLFSGSEYQYYIISSSCYLNVDVSTPFFIHCSIIVCDIYRASSDMTVLRMTIKELMPACT